MKVILNIHSRYFRTNAGFTSRSSSLYYFFKICIKICINDRHGCIIFQPDIYGDDKKIYSWFDSKSCQSVKIEFVNEVQNDQVRR